MPRVPTPDPKQFIQAAPLFTVPDVIAATQYYQRVLGFQSDAGAVSPDYGVVWRDNAAIHFRAGEHPPAGARVFFWVKDVDSVHDEVLARGARIAEPIGTRPYHVRDFSVRDVNGVQLVFGQDWD